MISTLHLKFSFPELGDTAHNGEKLQLISFLFPSFRHGVSDHILNEVSNSWHYSVYIKYTNKKNKDEKRAICYKFLALNCNIKF